MDSQQFRGISDSDGIDFEEVADESGQNNASTSGLCHPPPSKRQKVHRLPVDFGSTTDEEESDVDFQVF